MQKDEIRKLKQRIKSNTYINKMLELDIIKVNVMIPRKWRAEFLRLSKELRERELK